MRTIIAVLLSLSICVSCTTIRNESVSLPGELGSLSNPVRCDGPEGEREYLKRLFGPNGEPVKFYRVGSYGSGPYGNILDGYKVQAGSTQTMIYMDMYHPKHIETNCVSGFTIVNLLDELPVKIPANRAAHAEIMKNTIESVSFDDSVDEMILKINNLISSGIDVNASDAAGNTPLLIAARHLHRPFRVFKTLLDAGADVNAHNQKGYSALHMILTRDVLDLDALKLLIDAGISVTAMDNFGDTAFSGQSWVLDDEDREAIKPDTHLIAARLLLEAGAGKWKNYMARPVTVIPDSPDKVDPVVAQLADPNKRDAAFHKILSWQKYRSKPAGPERIFKPLRHVVVCPQEEGPPIYAVFLRTQNEQRAVPKGHVILIDADGAIIPYYNNANYIDDVSEFRDINGDGVIDEISTIGTGKAYILHVLPVTRTQQPSLNILLRKRGFNDTEWQWHLVETGEPDVSAIELGPMDSESKEIISKVKYQWSKDKQTYTGPKGADNLPFKRMFHSDPWSSKKNVEYDSFIKSNKKE